MLNEKIKIETKEGHQTLEKHVVQRLKSITGNEDYADLLKYFYAYFLDLEKNIAMHIPHTLTNFFQHRRNANDIATDVKELGYSLDNLPKTQLPPITNKNQAIGALYVLEGSIMGGPHIVKMLQQKGVIEGFNFFKGYGELSGKKWAEFTKIINSEVNDEAAINETILSAKETFQQFTNTFNNQINV
ncbi:MAG: biliverdin-producing heme oxygenase [Sphingobacterium sp.]